MSEEDRLRSFTELATALEAQRGIRLHVSTLHRMRQGVRGQKLKAIRLGGRWFARLSDLFALMIDPSDSPSSDSSKMSHADVQAKLKSEFGM